MFTKTYSGFIEEHSYGEGEDILFLIEHPTPLNYFKCNEEPLAFLINEDMGEYGHYLTVKYWISNNVKTKNQAKEDFVREIMGLGNAKFFQHYSEITGYLYTTEELIIGDEHDLLDELRSYKDRYCILEIEFNDMNFSN